MEIERRERDEMEAKEKLEKDLVEYFEIIQEEKISK